MKKLFALLLTAAMCLFIGACDGSEPVIEGRSAESDLAYVKEKGSLVVGITEFEPMDYQDGNGNWIGFDADMAAAFAESLGVEVQFRLIEWGEKVELLKDKTIDAVWNGMTLNDEVKAAMETSKPYFNNAQVVIVKADAADRYQTVEELGGAVFALEPNSAAEDQAIAYGLNYTEVQNQEAALQSVSDGNSDAAIVDFLMAIAMIGEGTGYPDLTYTVSLSSEEYGVGFRKGSDLAAALDVFFADSYGDGTMQSAARNYGISAFLLAQ